MMDRRQFLSVSALGAVSSVLACQKKENPAILRVGYFANLTHAVPLCGFQSNRFAQRVSGVQLVPQLFNAGPAAMEALLSGSIDLAYVGPTPMLTAWHASRKSGLSLLSGAASGGASLVIRTGTNIRSASDLAGKKLATPQYGNTQDLAARKYLQAAGLKPTDRGGTVELAHIANADIFAQFQLGRLDAAWVPEPWVSRLLNDAHGEILVDERDLWPERRFATTLLVARSGYLSVAQGAVDRFVTAHREIVQWIRSNTAEAQQSVQEALTRLAGRPLQGPVLQGAWSRTEFTDDLLPATIEAQASSAHALGFLPSADVSALLRR